jgi:hypothetical protein
MDFPFRLLDHLPIPSRVKIERLLAERDAARAVYLDAADRERDLWNEAALAEARAASRLAMHPGLVEEVHYARLPPGDVEQDLAAAAERVRQRNRPPPPDDEGYPVVYSRPLTADERATQVARINAPAEAIRRRHQVAKDVRERAEQRQAGFFFFENVAAWLDRAIGSGVELRHYAAPAPKGPGAANIDRLRGELAELAAKWEATEQAPVPTAILRERAVAEIERVAATGALKISPTSRGLNPLNLVEKIKVSQLRVYHKDGYDPMLMGDGGAPLMVWLFQPALVQAVDAMLSTIDQAGALDDDARDREFAKIARRRLEIERVEEAVIAALEADGRFVARRHDADPRAVLEVVEAE